MGSEEPEPGHTRDMGSDSAESDRPAEALDWSWPPYAPVEAAADTFDTADWAPSSTVWHPQLRVGRWTVLYRRSA